MSTNNEDRAQEPKIKTPCPSCGSQSLFVPEHGLLTCSVIGCKAPAMLNDMAMERRKQMEVPTPTLAERFPVGRKVKVLTIRGYPTGAIVAVDEAEEMIEVERGGRVRFTPHELELLPEDPTPAPWVPKVGERVRFLPSAIHISVPATVIGHCGIVREMDGEVFEVECDVEVSNNRFWSAEAEHIEPAPTPEPTGPEGHVEVKSSDWKDVTDREVEDAFNQTVLGILLAEDIIQTADLATLTPEQAVRNLVDEYGKTCDEVAAQKLRADAAELRLHRDAARLADEVAALVRRNVVDARSPVPDALLDFREPRSTARADRLADLDAEIGRLRAEVAAAKRVADHVGCMAGFVVFAAEQLRAACEPFRCDTFGCETKETEALDKACAEVDRTKEPGLLAAAKAHLESVVAAAVVKEREAISVRLQSLKDADVRLNKAPTLAAGLGMALAVVRGRPTPGAAKEAASHE